MEINRNFWKETAELIETYREQGRDDLAQAVVNCRIIYSKENP